MVSPTVDLQRRGHVARALQKYLKDHSLTVRQFNEQVLRTKPQSVVAYNWIAGRGMPGPDYIPILVEALGKDEAFFRPREAKPQRETMSAKAPAEPLAQLLAQDDDRLATDFGAPVKPPADAPQAAPKATPQSTPDEAMNDDAMNKIAKGVKAMWGRSYNDPAVRVQKHTRRRPKNSTEKTRALTKNTLTYTANGNGIATIKFEYTAPMHDAARVLARILDLNPDT